MKSTIRVALVAAAALLAVTACSSGHNQAQTAKAVSQPPASPNPSPTAPAAKVGQPVRVGPFEITVIRFEVAQRLPLTTDATAGGLQPYRPKNGQFVIVYATARNVGTTPARVASSESTLVDDAGRSYTDGNLYLSVAGQGFDQDQQPDTSASGMLVFDVPTSMGRAARVLVQPDAAAGVQAAPVDLGS